LYEPIELPSLEEIEQMNRQRDQALEALEIFDHSVKCQRCHNTVPIVAKLRRPMNDRVAILQKRIKWLETHYRDERDKAENLKALNAELTELLKEDQKYDILRSLPLQYWPSKGKYVCGACLDRLMRRAR
jgi:hypothetical protein